MSEKVILIKRIDTGRKTKDGKPVIEIETKDGRKGSAFDTLFLGLDVDVEYEMDIKPAPDYNNEKRFWFNMPKSGDQKKAFTKDWTFAKRDSSLLRAIESVKLVNKEVTSKNILALAEEYYEYLNKK